MESGVGSIENILAILEFGQIIDFLREVLIEYGPELRIQFHSILGLLSEEVNLVACISNVP